MDPEFTPITGVVIANPYTNEPKTVTGDVDTSYRSTLGETIGLTYLISPESRFTFGLLAYLPVISLGILDSGDTYLPEYFLYRASTQITQVHLGAGIGLGNGFSLGLGMKVGFGVTTVGNLFLKTNTNQPSTLRFSASIKPKVAPFFGMLFAPEGKNSTFTAGLVVRAPLNYNSDITLNADSQLLGQGSLPFSINATSSALYDPLAVELSLSTGTPRGNRAYVELDYQAWSQFQPPFVDILSATGNCTSTPCATPIGASQNLPFTYIDTFTPRVGYEFGGESFTLRLGYGFKPSILKELSTDAGNYIDPPKHMIRAGVGFHFKHLMSYNVPCDLDLNGAYDALVAQHITKSSGDESGGSGTKIGSPGYDTGGKIIGGGASLTVAF